ncbi:4'-phosphopantetheinyl transferase [Corynebacterium yudongzhengii]|uniref:4'-phosphopantetheinyl transferase n=1 Tax=Corynebacterium yudongzhengii TaxID=2080740 RepID=A0A2U1T574_9CORY|nr:4'-phosphopantetheinyl transferase superfamily protein [Corynebacterium yudongzhengii]AWB81723.1 4'-phosphopantetheinyl transferase [Corynebacterium yudongzhengii]PWC01156.1 4'-phosphopantetheinyl transferase [Corynebacterium yudongzhengii]
MLDDVLPTQVRSCYLITSAGSADLTNFEHLHPLERTIVHRAVDARRAEFGDARWCAHQALGLLGVEKGPILRGERGMPLWPTGVTGSLTHTEGFRAAAVAHTNEIASLGMDAEPAQGLPDHVLDSIARPSERPQLSELADRGIACADRLLFCAKEAVYKAWYPLTYRWLDFDGAEIALRDDGTFIAYLLVRPTPVPLIEGRWRISRGYVVTAAVVEKLQR